MPGSWAATGVLQRLLSGLMDGNISGYDTQRFCTDEYCGK